MQDAHCSRKSVRQSESVHCLDCEDPRKLAVRVDGGKARKDSHTAEQPNGPQLGCLGANAGSLSPFVSHLPAPPNTQDKRERTTESKAERSTTVVVHGDLRSLFK